MEYENINSLSFLKFDMNPKILLDTLEFAQTRNYNSSDGKTLSQFIITKYNDLPHLMSWIHQCLEETKKEIYPELHLDSKLLITQIWINKSSKMMYHHKHHHCNSLCSGIIYLNDDFDGGNTIFYTDNPWYSLHNARFFSLGNPDIRYNIENTIKPVSGRMLIFPSFITHKVTPVINNRERYTISFNTFIFGNFGTEDSLTHLVLNS